MVKPGIEAGAGAVEAAVQLPSGDGWLLVGWTPRRWAALEPAERVYAQHSFGMVTGEAHSVFHERADRLGFCTVLLGPTHQAAKLMGVEVAGLRLAVAPEGVAQEFQAVATLARRLAHAAGAGSRGFLDVLPRPDFDGVESVSRLWPPVHFGLDQAVRVGEDGLALAGSLIDTGRSVAQIAVHGGGRRVVLDPARWVTVRRPELLKDVAGPYGIEDDRVGFVAYAAGAGGAGTQPVIEIETTSGEFGFKPFRVFDSPALGVIKQFLSVPAPTSGRLQARFDDVLGPTVAGLIAARRPSGPGRDLAFGMPVDRAAVSVIIPLYGRIDFMELQLALFSERPGRASEIIYVLDDPSLEEAAERLAFACWSRFKLPFRLLILPENRGYAGANNAGLQAASGNHVCLLNSDVFPMAGEGLGWVERLSAHLERDRSLGAVGPRLLFGDGTVQHQGMHYERVPEFADWWFPIHTEKGAIPREAASLLRPRAITGACMVVRRAEVAGYGGLDEGYVIGDFEDADLCERLAEDGRGCAVDASVTLHHLERQSQGAGQVWRSNATLYNAWRFNRRWGEGIGDGS